MKVKLTKSFGNSSHGFNHPWFCLFLCISISQKWNQEFQATKKWYWIRIQTMVSINRWFAGFVSFSAFTGWFSFRMRKWKWNQEIWNFKRLESETESESKPCWLNTWPSWLWVALNSKITNMQGEVPGLPDRQYWGPENTDKRADKERNKDA